MIPDPERTLLFNAECITNGTRHSYKSTMEYYYNLQTPSQVLNGVNSNE